MWRKSSSVSSYWYNLLLLSSLFLPPPPLFSPFFALVQMVLIYECRYIVAYETILVHALASMNSRQILNLDLNNKKNFQLVLKLK